MSVAVFGPRRAHYSTASPAFQCRRGRLSAPGAESGSEELEEGPDTIEARVSFPGETETISAGTGDDLIFAEDGVVDDIDCGGGNDTVAVDPIDKVAPQLRVSKLAHR